MARSDAAWSRQEAQLLTLISLQRTALSLTVLLARCDAIVSVPPLAVFLESLGRLVGADLLIWSAGRFVLTAEGRAVAARAEDGGYYEEFFDETETALNARVPRPPPVDLGITPAEVDAALAEVAEAKERRRQRHNYLGWGKWAAWDDAPPLTLGDCIEFLAFSEGREVAVELTARDTTPAYFVATLGPPLPPRPHGHGDDVPIVFPLQSPTSDAPDHHIAVDPQSFESASYSSYDGIDHFTLTINHSDGRVIEIREP